MYEEVRGNNEDVFRLVGKDYQILVAKGFGIEGENIQDVMVPLVNKYKELFAGAGIELTLVDYEQPMFSDEIIASNQLLELKYDLFFRVELKDIIISEEKFLDFIMLKHRTNLVYLEDIVCCHPVYQLDPWYSDKISKMISWDISSSMKESIMAQYQSAIKNIKNEKPSNRHMANLIMIKSSMPPYQSDIFDLKDTGNLDKLINVLQLVSMDTAQNSLNIDAPAITNSKDISEIELLAEIFVKTIEIDIKLTMKNDLLSEKNFYDLDTLFGTIMPNLFRKINFLNLTEKYPDLNYWSEQKERIGMLTSICEYEFKSCFSILKLVLKKDIQLTNQKMIQNDTEC